MFYKFPSTPYIFLGNSIQKKEKNCLTDSEVEFLREPFSGQWKPLKQWINLHVDELFDILDEVYFIR